VKSEEEKEKRGGGKDLHFEPGMKEWVGDGIPIIIK